MLRKEMHVKSFADLKSQACHWGCEWKTITKLLSAGEVEGSLVSLIWHFHEMVINHQLFKCIFAFYKWLLQEHNKFLSKWPYCSLVCTCQYRSFRFSDILSRQYRKVYGVFATFLRLGLFLKV